MFFTNSLLFNSAKSYRFNSSSWFSSVYCSLFSIWFGS